MGEPNPEEVPEKLAKAMNSRLKRRALGSVGRRAVAVHRELGVWRAPDSTGPATAPERGLRHDGGDAETGSGVQLGGRVSYM